LPVGGFLILPQNSNTKINQNYPTLPKERLNLFQLFLTYIEIRKQNKKLGILQQLLMFTHEGV
jgi:hypothetical protein